LQIDTDLLRTVYHNKHCWRAFRGYQYRWPWTTLNPKIGGFSEFLAILACNTQLIAQKWFKIDYDNRHKKCLALSVDFNGVMVYSLGSSSPAYERIKCGYPLENLRLLLLSSNLAREWLQIDTDLLCIIPSTADMTNNDDLEPPKICVLSDFCYFRLWRTLRVKFRWNILQTDQDILSTKLNWCCGGSHMSNNYIWMLAYSIIWQCKRVFYFAKSDNNSNPAQQCHTHLFETASLSIKDPNAGCSN